MTILKTATVTGALLLSAAAAFTAARTPVPPKPAPGPVVARIDPATGKPAVVKGIVRKTFDDGLAVSSTSVEKWGARYVLIRKGHDTKHSIATATEIVNDGHGSFTMRATAYTETCSGSPCSSCSFTSGGGGCVCNDTTGGTSGLPTGFCNHTISTITPRSILVPTNAISMD